jgi:hypothetical protein
LDQKGFIPKMAQLREMTKYKGKIAFTVDDHVTHVTPRLIPPASSQKLPLIRFVQPSSHNAQPFDLCVFD